MAEQTNVFGFSTEPSAGGDFTPIIKYDARAGRVFRVDRVQSTDGFTNEPVDITATFKAVVDFENVEIGWIDFPVGSAPSFALTSIGNQLPVRPSAKHKNGIRFLLKLSKGCGGDKPVREIAGTSKAFLGGVEQVYGEYLREKAKYPGQLPVLSLVSTTPIVSGSGATKSTNYRPTFRIDGWAKRPDDLIHVAAAAPTAAATNGSGAATNGAGAAPSTGGQTVPPPNNFRPGDTVPQGNTNLDDDFG
jgi:hypothetical protein